ncbi:MAG: hypothetical protein ACQGQO_01050 [Sphaerochaetaceae bacterium]
MNFVIVNKTEYTPEEYLGQEDAPVFHLDVMTAEEAESGIAAHLKGSDYVSLYCKQIDGFSINGKAITTGAELVKLPQAFHWVNDLAAKILNLGLLEPESKND